MKSFTFDKERYSIDKFQNGDDYYNDDMDDVNRNSFADN